jgi:hypothetical protein
MSEDHNDDVFESTSRAIPSADGWVTPAVSYVDPARRFCQFCGRPIARRFWQVETAGGVEIFCDPAHASLYATYPISSKLDSKE